jgi:hypothetical protein
MDILNEDFLLICFVFDLYIRMILSVSVTIFRSHPPVTILLFVAPVFF